MTSHRVPLSKCLISVLPVTCGVAVSPSRTIPRAASTGTHRDAQGLYSSSKARTRRQLAEPASGVILLEKECYEGPKEFLEGVTPHMAQLVTSPVESPGLVWWAGRQKSVGEG